MSWEAWGTPPDPEPEYCPMCGERNHVQGCELGAMQARALKAEEELTNAYAEGRKDERKESAGLLEAAKAALAYDAAIQACANDPRRMASFCTAEGIGLDALYEAWIDASRMAVAKATGSAS